MSDDSERIRVRDREIEVSQGTMLRRRAEREIEVSQGTMLRRRAERNRADGGIANPFGGDLG